MLRKPILHLAFLELLVSTLECCLVELRLHRNMAQMAVHPHLLHLDKRDKTGKQMVALGAYRARRGLGKTQIALE